MAGTEVHRLSLLLVEDNPADIYLVKEAIQREGLDCQLEVAVDGERALSIIDALDGDASARCPDLLLLDLNVPRKGGDEVFQRIRQSPRCAGIPVIIITSSDSAADQDRARELGAAAYFRKPSDFQEFMKLGRLLRNLCQQTRV